MVHVADDLGKPHGARIRWIVSGQFRGDVGMVELRHRDHVPLAARFFAVDLAAGIGGIVEADPALAGAAGEQRASDLEKLRLDADRLVVDEQQLFAVPALKRFALGCGQTAHAVLVCVVRCSGP